MSQLPDDLLLQFMKMTGMNQKDAEKALNKSLKEIMTGAPAYSEPSKKKGRGAKPKYGVTDYPQFLPSDNIKKYIIRVALRGINPTIWRKFECPSNISLRHLTELILLLMGWDNAHLNHIMIDMNTFYVPCYQHNTELDMYDDQIYYQEEYKLSDILSQKGKIIRWEYDFGDSWMHEIRLSSVEEYEEGERHEIVFKGGKRACPPEDCGGIWGYQELLELHNKRKARKRLTAEEKERLEWYDIDRDYDPEELDVYECRDICDAFTEDHAEEVSQEMAVFPQDDAQGTMPVLTSSPLYDDVLSLAFRIRDLEPWEDLNDSDIYAVRMQDGSEVYVATMGYGGESYDVQLYDGAESFQSYLFLLKGASLPNFEIMEAHNWAEYVSIMYLEHKDELMEPYQYRFIADWAKEHQVKIASAHGCPFVQHFRPHRYQSMMTNDEQGLVRVKEALEAVEWFSQQILEAEDLTVFGFKSRREYPTDKGGKVVPLVVKTADGYKVERTKLPGRVQNYETAVLPESDYQPLRFLQKNGTQYCRLLHIPGFVGSENDPETGYASMLMLCMDKKTEQLRISEPCDLTDSIERDVLRRYMQKQIKEKAIPQRIITDDARTEAFFKDFCRQLGIILERSRTRIPLLTEACEYFYSMPMEGE